MPESITNYFVFTVRRKRWKPLRHAVRGSQGKFVSLCGTVGTRESNHAFELGNPWVVDVTCPRCLRAIRKGK